MERIACEIQCRGIHYLIPVTDISLIPALEYRETLFADVHIPYPPLATALQASDKYYLFQLAQECEVPIPKTIFVGQPKHAMSFCANIFNYPVVVKPARSVFRENDHLVLAGVSHVHTKEELGRLLAAKQYLKQYPFLIQERIRGPGIGYFVLLDRGEPIAEFSHRRIREKPPGGGVSVFSESIPLRLDVRDYSLRLLRKLGWSGIAMVEYKLDRRSDTPMLMEINGRFWGSLQLCISAGVDFPKLLVNMSTNGSAHHPPAQYRPYLRWRWVLGDLDNLLLRCVKSKHSLALPDGYPSRMRSVIQFFAAFRNRGMSYDVLCADDMRPFLYECNEYLKHLLW
jgi:predicted ATP-grasp superfamily ATP-dependent carboligase